MKKGLIIILGIILIVSIFLFHTYNANNTKNKYLSDFCKSKGFDDMKNHDLLNPPICGFDFGGTYQIECYKLNNNESVDTKNFITKWCY